MYLLSFSLSTEDFPPSKASLLFYLRRIIGQRQYQDAEYFECWSTVRPPFTRSDNTDDLLLEDENRNYCAQCVTPQFQPKVDVAMKQSKIDKIVFNLDSGTSDCSFLKRKIVLDSLEQIHLLTYFDWRYNLFFTILYTYYYRIRV